MTLILTLRVLKGPSGSYWYSSKTGRVRYRSTPNDAMTAYVEPGQYAMTQITFKMAGEWLNRGQREEREGNLEKEKREGGVTG